MRDVSGGDAQQGATQAKPATVQQAAVPVPRLLLLKIHLLLRDWLISGLDLSHGEPQADLRSRPALPTGRLSCRLNTVGRDIVSAQI